MQARQELRSALNDVDNIRDLVAEVVNTYHPAGEHGTEEKPEAYVEQREAMKRKAINVE